MTPYFRACELLVSQRYDPAVVFDHFYRWGYVYADPECLILAEPRVGHPPGDLFIFLAIGMQPLQRFCELAPRNLRAITFVRGLRGDLTERSYNFARFCRLCAHISPAVQPCSDTL